MKRFTTPLFTLLIFCACKKDKSVPDQPTIVGVWTPTTATYIDIRYKNGAVIEADTVEVIGQPGEFARFEKDGMLIIKDLVNTIMPDGSVIYGDEFETNTGTYTVSGTTLTMNDGIDKEVYAIDKLTSIELQVSFSEEVVLSADEKQVSKSVNRFKR